MEYVKIDPAVSEAIDGYAVNYGGEHGPLLDIDNGEPYDENRSVSISPGDFVKLRDILSELIDVLGLERE
jgi:hypothetical protein